MTKYLDPGRYTSHAFNAVNKLMLPLLEGFTGASTETKLSHPPVFFLGAPRSGSTLAIQVISDVFDFGYISNRHCQYFGAPALAERLFRPLADKPSSEYRSKHGDTEELYAPSECGSWWYRFFRDRPAYVTVDDVDSGKMKAFRRSVIALTNSFDRPVLFKNLYASLRIQAIARYLPESLFIVMNRSEVDNGHSLLETRMSVYGDYGEWWSMEPPQIDSLKKLPVYEQVIEQIRHIHKTINDDLRQFGVKQERVFQLEYEELCRDTHGVIDSLATFFESNQCDVNRIGDAPSKFTPRNEINIDQILYEKMQRYACTV